MIEAALRAPLSPREEQIAERIGERESYAEIGMALNMSPHTVRTYVGRIAAKIDLEGDMALEPRNTVYMFVMQRRWATKRKV